jgi:AraC family L-rhamnose operon regulatory protein RhaS
MKASIQRRPVEVRIPANGVFVLESHHAPGFRMEPQRHDFLEVFYVLQGVGEFCIEGRTHRCASGEVVVVPIGQVHRIDDHPSAPLALYGICIAPRVWAQEAALLEHVPAGALPVTGLLAGQVRDDLRRLLFEQALDRPGSRVMILGLALQLLARLARSAGHVRAATGYREAVQNRRAAAPLLRGDRSGPGGR